MKRYLIFVGIASLVLSLSSCGGKKTPNYYVVNFNSNGGSEIVSQKVEKGGKITKPTNPTKENFEFVNWTYQGEEWSFIGYTVTEDMTLDANWERTHYTVSFNSNGGSEIQSQKVAVGGKITKPTDPTRVGYAFANWTYQGEEWSFNRVATEDMVLMANWIETFTVSFNSNGGTDVSSQTVKKGDVVIKPTDPTRVGYEFVGWTYEGTIWNFSSSINKDITLVASWIQIFTVEFDSVGGTNIPSQTIRKGAKVKEPTVPTKRNYDFDCWKYNGVKWLFDQNTVNENITLVANWVYTGFDDEDFVITLSNGRSSMYRAEEAYIIVSGPTITSDVTFTYSSSDSSVANISSDGTIDANYAGQANIIVVAHKGSATKTQSFVLDVIEPEPATTSDCFIPHSTQEKTGMIGALEKYAFDNNLAGIPIAQNDKYLKFSERIKLATDKYIDNYGFGLVEEGKIDPTMPSITGAISGYQDYLHIAVGADTPPVTSRFKTYPENEFDLGRYITSSYWDKRMNDTKDGYVWRSVLSKDKVSYDNKEYEFNSPIPIYQNQEVKPGEELNETGLYNTWRVYVKTGSTDGLKYRYSGNPWNINLDGRNVELPDYEFSYRLLLLYPLLLKRAEASGYTAKSLSYQISGADYLLSQLNFNDSDETILSTWNKLKEQGILGIKTGTDETNGDYIQLTIKKDINRFDAIEMFSSRLLSPLPEEYILAIGEGDLATGVKRYGDFNNDRTAPEGHKNSILDYFICLGPYTLESWNKDMFVAAKKNDLWSEEGLFNYSGIVTLIFDTSQDSLAIYKRFMTGMCDCTNIPLKHLSSEIDQPRVYFEKGNSILKLNVNSCTQERWDQLDNDFWHNERSDTWMVKPWMNNDNFLKGLFYAINRKEFANSVGMSPSINLFPDCYQIDDGVFYNNSEAHKKAISAYQIYDSDGESTYGYSYDKAVNYFRQAVRELINAGQFIYGTQTNPFKINFEILWPKATDIKDYGDAIAKCLTDAFNDERVCGGRVQLAVNQEATTRFTDYVVRLLYGRFDLACDLNYDDRSTYIDSLKTYDDRLSTNHSCGDDTSIINIKKPLFYNNKSWSFDALLSLVNGSSIVDKGVIINPLEKCYLDCCKNDFSNGCDFSIILEFKELEGVEVSAMNPQIHICMPDCGYFDLTFTVTKSDTKIILNICLDAITAQEINAEIRRAFHMDDKVNYPQQWNEKPFTLENYGRGRYWYVAVDYSYSLNSESEQCNVSTIDYGRTNVAQNAVVA